MREIGITVPTMIITAYGERTNPPTQSPHDMLFIMVALAMIFLSNGNTPLDSMPRALKWANSPVAGYTPAVEK
jgi:hypothetical protein